MVIKDLRRYLSKEFPSVNLTREIGLCRRYCHLAGIEDIIRKQLRDYAFMCWQEDRSKVSRIEINLGSCVMKDQARKKDKAIEYLIAEDYLKNLREKKVVKKYHLYFWQSRFTSYSTVRVRVIFKPKDTIRFL